MGCCGQHAKSRGKADVPLAKSALTFPDEPCVFCAEKHLSTAWRIGKECGYESPNRQMAIGELVAAQWHLYREHLDLAKKIRDARHLIQWRREIEVDWAPIIAEINSLCDAEAARL